MLFRCPNAVCNEIFIGSYYDGKLERIGPNNYEAKNFDGEIVNCSSEFVKIYNQSLQAESTGLDQIAGLGYRKALEFLIKDYLIQHQKKDEERILKKTLSQCLEQDIDNENLKDMARRASWIGNDEAHYARKWDDKDVNDLKRLIEVTVHYVLMEILTDKYKEEMPK